MAALTIKPTIGLSRGMTTPDWFVDSGVLQGAERLNSLLVSASNPGNSRIGMVFRTSNSVLTYAKVTKAALNIKLNAQASLTKSAYFFAHPAAYTGPESMPKSPNLYRLSGTFNKDEIIQFNVTDDLDLILSSAQTAYGLVFSGTGLTSPYDYIMVDAAASTLVIEYTPYTLPNPTGLTPSSGSFPAGMALDFNWNYNPSSYPGDRQTGSRIEYSLNSGSSWVGTNISGTANRYSYPANRFDQSAKVQFRVRNESLVGDSGFTSSVTLTAYQTKAPDTLTPGNGAYRNPAAVIPLSWNFAKSSYKDDIQSGSSLRYRVNGGAWVSQTVNGRTNAYTFRAGAFKDGDRVEWQVQTDSLAGLSPWSYSAAFTLAITPPLAPILIYPVNADVSAANGVPLEWLYNSEYDTAPSRFDVEYRIDGGDWKTFSNEGQITALLPAEDFADGAQHTVDWRVLGYSQFGDKGAWSETAAFWTIGLPSEPVILSVSNSNRPVITFSMENAAAWELEVLKDGEAVYQTGTRPFQNILSHKLADFIPNGSYTARLRIINEYSLKSAWGGLAFTVETEPPEKPELRVLANSVYCVSLYVKNFNRAYVYRSEYGKDDFKRIGEVTNALYEDYTAGPGKSYEYFVRAVNDDDSFADSGREYCKIDFSETMIADALKPSDMVKLVFGLGVKPKKVMTLGHDAKLVRLEGRDYPLLVKGGGRTQTISYSFYIGREELDGLSRMAASGNVLILREPRYGAVYGGITGDINVVPENVSEQGEFSVGFIFTRTDYEGEVNL